MSEPQTKGPIAWLNYWECEAIIKAAASAMDPAEPNDQITLQNAIKKLRAGLESLKKGTRNHEHRTAAQDQACR